MNRLCIHITTWSILIYAFAAAEMVNPPNATAGIVPDGSRVFLTVSGPPNICGPADENHNQFCAVAAAPNVPVSIPLTTFTDPRGANFGYITTSKDVMTGKTMHGTMNTRGGEFGYLSFNDTYTVHGTASGSFPITVTFHITGSYGTLPNTTFGNLMGGEASQLEIGTFHPEATLTQFVIDPFPADAQNSTTAEVSQTHSGVASPTPLIFPWDVQVSYTKIVSINDVFDFAYGLDMNMTTNGGAMDLNPTGADVISFSLPSGVFLTSALGATFGTPNLFGDYNYNGTVDAADYVVWRKYDGTTKTLPNDPTGGTIGTAQYNSWRANFGKPPGSGSGSTVTAVVPEPTTHVLMMIAAASWWPAGSRAHNKFQHLVDA